MCYHFCNRSSDFNAFAPKTWIAFVVCGIADIILALFMFFGSKRTKAGNQVYGQILGFKGLSKKAELDRLKMLVEENQVIIMTSCHMRMSWG